jgi:hypothetical protein
MEPTTIRDIAIEFKIEIAGFRSIIYKPYSIGANLRDFDLSCILLVYILKLTFVPELNFDLL